MRSAVLATVSGRVQMVMYRDFAERKAQTLGIVGEVENHEDGTVRVYAEGEKESLERFVELLKKGSLFSSVEHVQYKFIEPKGGFTKFFIRYT